MASLRNVVTATAPTRPWSAPPAPAPRRAASRLSLAAVPHRLFRALDGRQLTAAKRTWRLEVYAVVDDGDTRWIQLALQGLDRLELTLSAPRSFDANQIASALRSGLSQLLAPASVLSIA